MVKDPDSAHLIDEELQLQNGGSALVLTVGVHSRSSQSDVSQKSRKHRKIYFGVEKRERQKTSDNEREGSDEVLPLFLVWKVCFGSHESVFENSRHLFCSGGQKNSKIEKCRA